jgi:hypothetical protein
MDATRKRRTRDRARRAWYARHRQLRFSRWLGFFHAADPGDGRPRRVADSVADFRLTPRARRSRTGPLVLASPA